MTVQKVCATPAAHAEYLKRIGLLRITSEGLCYDGLLKGIYSFIFFLLQQVLQNHD